MLKWITAIILLCGLGLWFVSQQIGRSFRAAAMIEGRSILRQSQEHLLKFGYITNHHSSYRVRATNNIISVGGIHYQCFAVVRGGKFYDEGALGITTNGIFIWLDATRPPKLVEASYRPPFFAPRF